MASKPKTLTNVLAKQEFVTTDELGKIDVQGLETVALHGNDDWEVHYQLIFEGTFLSAEGEMARKKIAKKLTEKEASFFKEAVASALKNVRSYSGICKGLESVFRFQFDEEVTLCFWCDKDSKASQFLEVEFKGWKARFEKSGLIADLATFFGTRILSQRLI